MKIQLKRISVKLLHQKLQSRKLTKSIEFLLSKRLTISDFSNIEDFIWYIVNNPSNEFSGFEHHFQQVRLELAKKLWAEEIFIGISVVESLLFSIIRDVDTSDPLKEFLERIQDFGIHRPGLIIYPIHSFGVLSFGAYRFFTKTEAYFMAEDSGIAITPQSNSKEVLYSLLDQILINMGISQKIPRDLLEHYMRSRPLEWLINNPLLFVRARTFTGGYYENQFLLLIKLKISKSLILMLSVLGKVSSDSSSFPSLFSSSQINNFQTLDINHYLIFQVTPKRNQYLDGNCVPMNVSRAELAELSSLNVQLDPREWKRRPKLFDRVKNALSTVEQGYVNNCISINKETVRTRVYRKIFDSLRYFERSFRESSGIEDSVVNLAISFESLLTDYYAPGATKRILKNLKVALHGVKGTRELQKSVSDLYEARGAIVHLGRTSGSPDLMKCRKAFIFSFLFIVENLENLPRQTETPIGDLLK